MIYFIKIAFDIDIDYKHSATIISDTAVRSASTPQTPSKAKLLLEKVESKIGSMTFSKAV